MESATDAATVATGAIVESANAVGLQSTGVLMGGSEAPPRNLLDRQHLLLDAFNEREDEKEEARKQKAAEKRAEKVAEKAKQKAAENAEKADQKAQQKAANEAEQVAKKAAGNEQKAAKAAEQAKKAEKAAVVDRAAGAAVPEELPSVGERGPGRPKKSLSNVASAAPPPKPARAAIATPKKPPVHSPTGVQSAEKNGKRKRSRSPRAGRVREENGESDGKAAKPFITHEKSRHQYLLRSGSAGVPGEKPNKLFSYKPGNRNAYPTSEAALDAAKETGLYWFALLFSAVIRSSEIYCLRG